MPDTLLRELRRALGPEQVLGDGEDDWSAYTRDWRRRYQGRARAILRPDSVEAVQTAMALCARHGVGVVPQGGNTGLVGGGVPDDSGRQVVMSLTRLKAVRAVDVANMTLTVEAGCRLSEVQRVAAKAGCLFPLSLASEGLCTVGGNLATNAGGTQVLRYGNARDLCLGLEVVTPHGERWDGLSGLRKDNTGYDLRNLFIGSEGTLGVITAAVLKLHPAPAHQATALASCADVAAAVALLKLCRQQLDAGLTAFELMGGACLSLVQQHFPALPSALSVAPWSVLLEWSGTQASAPDSLERVLAEAHQRGLVSDATLASSQTQSQRLWQLREAIPLAQSAEGLNVKHDISLPVSAIPDFITHTAARIQQGWPGARLITFGHLGDGNLHYNVQAPSGVSPEAFLRTHEAAINQLVYDEVCRHDGSISAEHGIGQLKVAELQNRKSPVALGMMRAIKQALDPQGLMNPGKMLT